MRKHSQRKVRPQGLPSIFGSFGTKKPDTTLAPQIHANALITGSGTPESFMTVVYRLWLGKGMMETLDLVSKEAVWEFLAPAMGAMYRVGERFIRTQKWGFSGSDIGRVLTALNIIDELETKGTRRENKAASTEASIMVSSIARTTENLSPYRDYV